jgi:hypothetical protein
LVPFVAILIEVAKRIPLDVFELGQFHSDGLGDDDDAVAVVTGARE